MLNESGDWVISSYYACRVKVWRPAHGVIHVREFSAVAPDPVSALSKALKQMEPGERVKSAQLFDPSYTAVAAEAAAESERFADPGGEESPCLPMKSGAAPRTMKNH